MTTDQEAEDVAASVLHLMTQRGKDARNWEQQALDWKAVAEKRRAELSGILEDARALSGRYTALCAAADQAISNLRGMKALNDDPHIEEMIDETADLLANGPPTTDTQRTIEGE